MAKFVAGEVGFFGGNRKHAAELARAFKHHCEPLDQMGLQGNIANKLIVVAVVDVLIVGGVFLVQDHRNVFGGLHKFGPDIIEVVGDVGGIGIAFSLLSFSFGRRRLFFASVGDEFCDEIAVVRAESIQFDRL